MINQNYDKLLQLNLDRMAELYLEHSGKKNMMIYHLMKDCLL